jgi:hypothetical protein
LESQNGSVSVCSRVRRNKFEGWRGITLRRAAATETKREKCAGKVLGLFLGRNNLQFFSGRAREIHQEKILRRVRTKIFESLRSFTQEKHSGKLARLSH